MIPIEQKKNELAGYVTQDNNLPAYFVDLVLWKLENEEVTEHWINIMRQRIEHVEKYISS